MSWIYEAKTVTSAKNGRIRCRRWMGRWEIYIGTTHESSRYLSKMWRDAADRLPEDFKPARMLMIGLGLGDALGLWLERYPECRMSSIEWDPVIIRLAREFKVTPAWNRAGLMLGDAASRLPLLKGPYDLIQLDAFIGERVSPTAADDRAVREIARLLSPHGLLLFNAYCEPERFNALDKRLERVLTWRFDFNHLAFYRRRIEESKSDH